MDWRISHGILTPYKDIAAKQCETDYVEDNKVSQQNKQAIGIKIH